MSGDKNHSRQRIANDKYRANYDNIFGKNEAVTMDMTSYGVDLGGPDRWAIWRCDIECPQCGGGFVAQDKFGIFCRLCPWGKDFSAGGV